eukprot:1182235-Prorocentrum_minimum.AAC.2
MAASDTISTSALRCTANSAAFSTTASITLRNSSRRLSSTSACCRRFLRLNTRAISARMNARASLHAFSSQSRPFACSPNQSREKKEHPGATETNDMPACGGNQRQAGREHLPAAGTNGRWEGSIHLPAASGCPTPPPGGAGSNPFAPSTVGRRSATSAVRVLFLPPPSQRTKQQ